MSSIDQNELKKEAKKYNLIFGMLVTGSLVSVAISYLNLPTAFAVFFAVAIALTQVFIAAGYFMHLISERRVVLYITLAFTIIFLVALLSLPLFESHNQIFGTVNSHVH